MTFGKKKHRFEIKVCISQNQIKINSIIYILGFLLNKETGLITRHGSYHLPN